LTADSKAWRRAEYWADQKVVKIDANSADRTDASGVAAKDDWKADSTAASMGEQMAVVKEAPRAVRWVDPRASRVAGCLVDSMVGPNDATKDVLRVERWAAMKAILRVAGMAAQMVEYLAASK
jgi:hypothetical protein